MAGRDEVLAERDRARLIAVMDRYLEALDARDVRGLPIALTLRCTENTRVVPLGIGMWRTIRGRRKPGHYFADVEAGQAEYWTVIDEMGSVAIYGVRLRVAGQQISEIETVVVRGAGPYFDADGLMASPQSFHDVIPVEQRVPRAQLVRLANQYFDAIELADSARLPVTAACVRRVNGIIDSNMDPVELAKLDKGEAHRGLSVAAQIDAGYYAYIEALRARRYPVIDEARGLIMAHVMFDHPGDRLRSGGIAPMPYPNSILAYEVFKARNGVLQEVWAIGGVLPYAIESGWPA